MKRIAVLTSGGDAPGMNAAVRAVVRSGADRQWEVMGIRRGYAGLLQGDISALGTRDVSGIIQRGGTVLGTARCPEFKNADAQQRALKILHDAAIDALVVIGGDGSQTGAHRLSIAGFPVVGVASTIDNDLIGSDVTIGTDTALNVALEAVDRIKTTASSHQRAFLVEVMGRDCGYLALMTAIAGGAEVAVLPEIPHEPHDIATELASAYRRGKKHAIGIVSEGARWNAHALAVWFREHETNLGFEVRTTALGHIQRGGDPGAFDRILATRLGTAAIEALAEGRTGVLAGLIGNHIAYTPLERAAAGRKPLDPAMVKLASMLAR